MEIEQQILSYSQVKEGINLVNDPFEIGKYCFLPSLQKTFLSNPNLLDGNSTMMILSRIDKEVNGRVLFFPSTLKKNDELIPATGGSSLFVSETGRRHMLGADLILHPILNPCSKVLLYGGMTPQAIAIYEKLKFRIFDIPQSWQIRNIKPVLMRIGLKGASLKYVSSLANFLICPFISVSNKLIVRGCSRFTVEPLSDIPDWVEKMVLSDSHKYAEYHNKEWFSWVLNNNFFDSTKNKKSLLGIFIGGQPCGFLLLSEQDTDLTEAGVGKVSFGRILEWGVTDENIINERQIFRIAISMFSKNVDVVSISSLDTKLLKSLRKFGFFKHGTDNMAVKDLCKVLDNDSKDINNWRIRSCSDTPFY